MYQRIPRSFYQTASCQLMITQPLLLSLCTAIALSACSASSTLNNSTKLFSQVDSSKALNQTQMQIYVASAQSQLLILEQQETKSCISGQLAIAQSFLAQATREHKAKMEKDAFITLVELDRQIRKIRCINQYIKGQFGCKFTNKKMVLKRWYSEGDFEQCKKPSMAKRNIEKKYTLITETLHDFDQDAIKPIYYQSLKKIIDLIEIYPSSTLHIIGHTDSKGNEKYNSRLSKRRAQNVAKYFIDKGVEASQIVIEGQGEKRIREVENSEVSRVFNRFTSIILFLDTRNIKTI